jgi:hypothetical protein
MCVGGGRGRGMQPKCSGVFEKSWGEMFTIALRPDVVESPTCSLQQFEVLNSAELGVPSSEAVT